MLEGVDLENATELMRTIQPQHRMLLYVALFLHDIAKGRHRGPLDRRRAGRAAASARGSASRRPRPRPVAWLVEQHLVMSTVAQSRDLSDRKTIENFAAVVQSLERMKLLTILTTADIRAVGPGVWNGWKAQLLRTLYYETEPVLTGGFSEVNRAQRVAMAQAEFRAELKDWPAGGDRRLYRAALSGLLAQGRPAAEGRARALHARQPRRPARRSRPRSRFDAARGVTELTVLAPDHPWLLSIIAGACAVAGANIVDAQIFTTTDGRALDTIAVSREFERDEDEARRAARIADIDREGAARRSAAAGSGRASAPAAQGADQGVRDRAGGDHQQSMVEPLHRGRGDRPRPAGPAVRADRDALQAQSQHRARRMSRPSASARSTCSTSPTCSARKITSPTRQAAIKRALLGLLAPTGDRPRSPCAARPRADNRVIPAKAGTQVPHGL